MPAAAAKLAPESDPLDAAELDQKQAGADVARLTTAIAELRKKGPGADPALLGHLQTEREDALKILRRADLEAAETAAADGAPVSAKALGKIRKMRHRAETLHASVMARMGETRSLREHLGAVKGEIASVTNSQEFRQDQQEMRNAYLTPRDPDARDQPPPARGRKSPKSAQSLARLERDLETTVAELTISMAAQAAASERWSAEKRVLDGWLEAIRRQGPAAQAALNAMPHPGADTMSAATNQTDFRLGIPGHTSPSIR